MMAVRPIETLPESLAEIVNDASIDRMFVINTSWEVTLWNKASEIATGKSKADMMGRGLLDGFPEICDDEAFCNAIRKGFAGFKSFLPSSQAHQWRKTYESHFVPLPNADQSIAGVLNIMHEVSHRIKYEKQLEDLNKLLSQKYRELERVSNEFHSLTHLTIRELQQPIQSIYTGIELFLRAEAKHTSNATRGNFRKMQTSINRMNLLLDDLSKLSQTEYIQSDFSKVDLNIVLRKVLENMEKKLVDKGAEIHAGSLPQLYGYGDMLELLFFHLIDNAIKFRKPEVPPVINVSGQVVFLSSGAYPSLSNENEEVIKLTVADNGIGFPEEHAERIFRVFETLHGKKYPGTGVGLAICRRVAEAHQGWLEAHSEEGQGSSFTIFIPLRKKEYVTNPDNLS